MFLFSRSGENYELRERYAKPKLSSLSDRVLILFMNKASLLAMRVRVHRIEKRKEYH